MQPISFRKQCQQCHPSKGGVSARSESHPTASCRMHEIMPGRTSKLRLGAKKPVCSFYGDLCFIEKITSYEKVSASQEIGIYVRVFSQKKYIVLTLFVRDQTSFTACKI